MEEEGKNKMKSEQGKKMGKSVRKGRVWKETKDDTIKSEQGKKMRKSVRKGRGRKETKDDRD
jgi:hypothetical protein